MSGKELYNEYLDILTEIYNREAAYRSIDLDAVEDILNEFSIQTAEDFAPALQHLNQSSGDIYLISDIFSAINSHLGPFLEEVLSPEIYPQSPSKSPRNESVSNSLLEESVHKSILNSSIRKKTNRSQISNISSSRLGEFQPPEAVDANMNEDFDLMSELLNLSKASISKKDLSEIPIRTAKKDVLGEFTNRLMNIEPSSMMLFKTTSFYNTLDYVIQAACLEVSEVAYDNFRKYIIDRYRILYPTYPLPSESSAMGTDQEVKPTTETVSVTNKHGEQETWQIQDELEKDAISIKDNLQLVIKLFEEVEKEGVLNYMNYFESIQEWFIHEDVHLLPLVINPEDYSSLPEPIQEVNTEELIQEVNTEEIVQEVNKEEKIVQKLRQTIQEYVELRQTKQNSGEDCIAIDSLILTLEDQLAKILSGKNLKPPLRPKPKDQEQRKLKNKEKNQEKELTAEEKSKDPLMEIFEFYAKQQNNIIKAPLIEQLAQNYCILNLAKFMRFLKEFEIMDTIKRKDRRTLDSNISKTIFKKNATNAKDMNYDQFVQALGMVAILYFDNEYDKIFKTEYKTLSLPEKRTKLYSFIGCDQPEIYRAKLKGFSIAFSTNTEYRIPENDLAKNYKYRPYKHQKMPIEEWKKQKQQQIQIQPHKPIRPKRQSEAQSPNFKALSDPAAPVQLKDLEKQTDSYLKKKINKQPRNPFTWQGLGEMNPDQLKDVDDDFDIKNLILQDESDEDDYLNRQYPLAVMSEAFNSPVKPDLPKSESVSNNFSVKAYTGNSKNYNPAIPGNSNSLKGPNTISKQALERAQEINESQKKTQDEQLKRIMKIADAQIANAKKVTAKLGKYKS